MYPASGSATEPSAMGGPPAAHLAAPDTCDAARSGVTGGVVWNRQLGRSLVSRREGVPTWMGRRASAAVVVLVVLLSSVLLTAASAVAEPGVPEPVPPADGSAGLPALPGPPALPGATGPRFPANDFEALLALPPVRQADMVPTRTIRGPELMPVPGAECDDDSRPLAGMQGRVPADAINSPAARRGWTCNV